MRKNIRILSIVVIIMSMLLAACATTKSPATTNKTAAQAAVPATTQTQANTTPAAQAPGNTTAAAQVPPDKVQAQFAKLIDSLPAEVDYGYIHADVLNADMNYPNKPFLVDVRDPAEVKSLGYIAGAVNIPLRSLLSNLNQLPTQGSSIVVYSNSGYRSGMALAALMLLGYTNVHDLDGGLYSWVHSYKLPIVTGQTPAAPSIQNPQLAISDQATFNSLSAFLSNLPQDNFQVDALTLSSQMRGTTPPTLIDMNTANDHQQYGVIQGAINIPYANFFNSINQLPSKNTPIVIYAVGGGHSSIIVMGLREMGYTNVYSLKGGILAWKADNLPVQASTGN